MTRLNGEDDDAYTSGFHDGLSKIRKFMKILSVTNGNELENGDVAIPFQTINTIYNKIMEDYK